MFDKHVALLEECSEILADSDNEDLVNRIDMALVDTHYADCKRNIEQVVDLIAVDLISDVPQGINFIQRNSLSCKIAAAHIKVKALKMQERFNYCLDMLNRTDLYVAYD